MGIDKKLADLNSELKIMGMCEIALIPPESCKPQKLNARYMDQQTIKNLKNNVINDGRLESVPLVARNNGNYEIIS